MSRPRGLSAFYINEAERMQELMNDKSVLRLALLSKDNWIKNDERPHCYYCQRKFRPFVRKHHCRACGEIVCRSCNHHRKVQVGPTDQQTINVRLCFDCIDKALIGAGKTESHHSQDDTTPDCNFMSMSQSANGSSAYTVSTTASAQSTAATGATAITDSMASLEFSICESSVSDLELDSSSSEASGDEREYLSSRARSRSSTLSSTRASNRRQQQQILRTYSNHIEFLPEEEQHEIYEIRRQELLELYGIMDSGCQAEYDALCELASRALECNVAAVGFIDSTRQWYKARLGISQRELPRNIAFCSQLLQNLLPTIIMDASQDPRFRTNPLVTGSAGIRFYATTPICDPASGIVIGSVFVMDPESKKALPPRAVEILAYLSTVAEKLLLSAKREEQMQQQHLQQQLEQAERRSTMTIRKRKQRVHSAPAIPTIDEQRQFTQQRPDTRAASLQCVPEELETKDDFAAGISHTLPRDTSERQLYQLFDPDMVLPRCSLPRRNSESVLKSTSSFGSRASRASASSTASTVSSRFSERSMSFTSSTRSSVASETAEEEQVPPPPPPSLHRNELSRSSPQLGVAQPATASNGRSSSSVHSSSEGDGGACFDLICQITSTQQLLAEQQSAFMATLSQHSSRIGSMEKTMDRIEGIMTSLYLNSSNGNGNSNNSQQLYEVEI